MLPITRAEEVPVVMSYRKDITVRMNMVVHPLCLLNQLIILSL